MKLVLRLVNSLLRTAKRIVITIISLVKLNFQKEYWDKSLTYFPEFSSKQKGRALIRHEQRKWILKYSRPNKFYFLYGFDVKGLRNHKEYVDAFYEFSVARDRLNQASNSPFIVLRDKSLFGIVAEAYGVNTPKNLGIIQNGKYYSFSDKTTHLLTQLSVLIQKLEAANCRRLCIKKIDGECANGVFLVEIINGVIYYKDKPIDSDSFFERGSRYLVQEAICNQHPAISSMHPKAINTIRLCTVYDKQSDDIVVLSCVLRVGRGENTVDNWAAGGLSIGIDTERGTLREYGFYKPGFGTKATEHPDSHIIFKDYKIPYMREALEQAKEFHRRLYGIHSIGWDIAITENGPCFIEGNDNWEVSLMQISNHGLKKEFDRLFK